MKSFTVIVILLLRLILRNIASAGAVDGHIMRGNSQDTAMLDLMQQVAQGNMDPGMAASYVQQMMNASQVNIHIDRMQ